MAFASPSTAGLGAADGLAGGAAVDCVVAAGSYESTVSWRTAPTVAARSRHCDSGHADGEAEGVGECGGVEGDGFAALASVVCKDVDYGIVVTDTAAPTLTDNQCALARGSIGSPSPSLTPAG